MSGHSKLVSDLAARKLVEERWPKPTEARSMTDREIDQQAAAALEAAREWHGIASEWTRTKSPHDWLTHEDAIDAALCALRERLARPVHEPVASNNYVQPVPDHCDRIVWRNRYYHLPLPLSKDAASPEQS